MVTNRHGGQPSAETDAEVITWIFVMTAPTFSDARSPLRSRVDLVECEPIPYVVPTTPFPLYSVSRIEIRDQFRIRVTTLSLHVNGALVANRFTR